MRPSLQSTGKATLGNDNILHDAGNALGARGDGLQRGPETAAAALELLTVDAVPETVLGAGSAGRVDGAGATSGNGLRRTNSGDGDSRLRLGSSSLRGDVGRDGSGGRDLGLNGRRDGDEDAAGPVLK